MRAGLLGGPTGDAVGNVQSAFSSLFLRDVPLDDEGLAHVRKVEVIVQFRGGPDFSGFYSSVIRGRMLHEMRFPAILEIDRKSTRLNSSHVSISYAVFCLKKKNSIICGLDWSLYV